MQLKVELACDLLSSMATRIADLALAGWSVIAIVDQVLSGSGASSYVRVA